MWLSMQNQEKMRNKLKINDTIAAALGIFGAIIAYAE